MGNVWRILSDVISYLRAFFYFFPITIKQLLLIQVIFHNTNRMSSTLKGNQVKVKA